MKIKDIPYPALRELALKEQAKNGKQPNEESSLHFFNWEFSSNGSDFWTEVNKGNYDKARKIFDWDKKETSFDKITSSILKMITEKDKNYGNSANKPLNIFGGKATYGSRIDEKLARVKNSVTLRKNDVADIIGGLILICQEKGWDNFDDLID